MDEDEEAYFEGDEEDDDTENENQNDSGPLLPFPRMRPANDPNGDGDTDHLLNGKGRPPLTQRKSIEFVRAPLSLNLAGSSGVTNTPLVDYPLEDEDDALESLRKREPEPSNGVELTFPNPILSTPPRERKPPPSSGRMTPSKRTSSDREFELEAEAAASASASASATAAADNGDSPVTPEEVNMMDIEPRGKRSRAS